MSKVNIILPNGTKGGLYTVGNRVRLTGENFWRRVNSDGTLTKIVDRKTENYNAAIKGILGQSPKMETPLYDPTRNFLNAAEKSTGIRLPKILTSTEKYNEGVRERNNIRKLVKEAVDKGWTVQLDKGTNVSTGGGGMGTIYPKQLVSPDGTTKIPLNYDALKQYEALPKAKGDAADNILNTGIFALATGGAGYATGALSTIAPSTMAGDLIGYTAAGMALDKAGNLVYLNLLGHKNTYMDDAYKAVFGSHSDPYSRFGFELINPAYWPGWVGKATGQAINVPRWVSKTEDAISYSLSRPKVESQGVFLKPWASDPSKLNIAQRFGIKGLPERGYFELVWDLEPKLYSVHFKPTVAKSDAFNPKEKKVLFKAIANELPEGSYLSTWAPPGSTGISRGGVAGLNRFGNLGFRLVGTRPAVMKGTGEAVELPVWQKVSSETILRKPFGAIRIGNYYYRVDPNSMNSGFPKIERIKINGKDFESIDYGPLNLNRGTANPESDLFGRFIDDGSEAYVFENPADPNTVLKVNTDWRGSLQDFSNKYIAFRNKVPYQKPLTLKGRTSEGFPVMSLERVTPMNQEQFEENLPKIKQMIEEKGFKGNWEEGGPFSNGKLSINDLSEGNVGFDADGNIVFLDVHAYPTPWKLEPLPGMQIKSLMMKGPLEKQISKSGTISVKLLLAYIGRNDVPAVDRYLIGKVLENHYGETHLDYNALRKEVQGMIPKYERVPLTKYADYGLDRLGFSVKRPKSEGEIRLRSKTFDLEGNTVPKTFTFESPGLKGNTKHYPGEPLGHSRTYTTPEESDVLHVMESLSDLYLSSRLNDPIQARMADTYTLRLIQENLRYAAENGQTKMRYPTPETAAKIEGYSPLIENYSEAEVAVLRNNEILLNTKLRELDRWETPETLRRYLLKYPDDLEAKNILSYSERYLALHPEASEIPEFEHEISEGLTHRISPFVDQVNAEISALKAQYRLQYPTRLNILFPRPRRYSSAHQTILNKYKEFPKQYEKLFGKGTVREVMDAKGNTWYEVDVPEAYRNGTAEILFAHKPYKPHIILEEIPLNWIKRLEQDSGVTYVDFTNESPFMKDLRTFYELEMVPRAKNYNINLPLMKAADDWLAYIDPGTNPIALSWFKGRKGTYRTSLNLGGVKVEVTPEGKVLTAKGSTIEDALNTAGHEGLSHPTDKFMTEEIIKEYKNVLKELGITPKDIEEIQKSSPVVWQELRSTLNEVKLIAHRKGIDLKTATDTLLLELLKEVGSSYASAYSRMARRNNAWNAIRKGLTLPLLLTPLMIPAIQSKKKGGRIYYKPQRKK